MRISDVYQTFRRICVSCERLPVLCFFFNVLNIFYFRPLWEHSRYDNIVYYKISHVYFFCSFFFFYFSYYFLINGLRKRKRLNVPPVINLNEWKNLSKKKKKICTKRSRYDTTIRSDTTLQRVQRQRLSPLLYYYFYLCFFL